MAEPSPCSEVAKMMLCDVLSKELVQGAYMRRSLRENVCQELARQGGGEALRNCASEMGKLFIDVPEKGRSRPPLPARLLVNANDEKDTDDMAILGSMKSVANRAPTPFRWNTPSTPATSAGSARFANQFIDPSHELPDCSEFHVARWPSPTFGRRKPLPVELSADHAAPSNSGSLRRITESQSVPVLNLPKTAKNSRLAATIAKMRTVKTDHTAHLRRSAMQMGVPTQVTSSYMSQSTGPIQKAADPKWSTDLKRMDRNVGNRLKYETRLSAGGATLCPELHNLPKTFF